MEITTILLDGGGVIIDESELETAHARAIAGVIATLLPQYTTSNYWSDIDEAVRSFCPDVYRFVLWKYTEGNLPLFEDLHQRYLAAWKEDRPPLKLFDGIAEEISALSRRFKLAIAGQYGHEITDLLKTEGLLNFFAYHFTQDDFAITKPDPRYYEQIASKAESNPAQCVMVGDRVDKDIIPARQLGMKTVLIRTGIHRRQRPRIPFETPDMELDGIWGLAREIERLADGAA